MIRICYYICATSVKIPAGGVGIFWDGCGNRSRSDKIGHIFELMCLLSDKPQWFYITSMAG